jgi:hypothetical protein
MTLYTSELAVCYFVGCPRPVPKREMKDSVNIKLGIQGFIKYWKDTADQDISGQYMESIAPTISYWEGVLAAMDLPSPPTPSELSEPFWPTSRFSIAAALHEDNAHLFEENITDYAYVGPASSRPAETFRPGAHIRVGHYVLLRPSDDCPDPVWMGRVISEPNLAHVGPHPRSIEIVYYVPVLGPRNKKTLDDRYKEWDTAKSFKWTRLKEYAPARQSLDCVVASWARQKNASDDNVVIPARQILFAKDNLDRCARAEHMTDGDQFEDGPPPDGL